MSLVDLIGSFAPQSANPPLATYNGQAFSVMRTSAGTYLLKFFEPFVELCGGSAQIQLHTPVNVKAVIGDFTPASDGVTASLLIYNMSATIPQDIAPDPQNRILFHLLLRSD